MTDSDVLRADGAARNTVTGVARPADLWQPGDQAADTPPDDSPAGAAMAGTAPADGPAQPDDDDAGGSGRIHSPASARAEPTSGADASSHGGR